MTFNYIVLLIAWTVLLIVTVLQQRTIKHQTKANDYLLDDIATLENKNDLLNIELKVKERELKDASKYTDYLYDRIMNLRANRVMLQEHVQDLETLLKRLDPDGYVIDFDDGLKPYASTVGEIVDKHVK